MGWKPARLPSKQVCEAWAKQEVWMSGDACHPLLMQLWLAFVAVETENSCMQIQHTPPRPASIVFQTPSSIGGFLQEKEGGEEKGRVSPLEK